MLLFLRRRARDARAATGKYNAKAERRERKNAGLERIT